MTVRKLFISYNIQRLLSLSVKPPNTTLVVVLYKL